MRVRMMATAAGPAGTFQFGQVYDLDGELGAAFVAAGAAERLDGAPEIETPEDRLPPVEQAVVKKRK